MLYNLGVWCCCIAGLKRHSHYGELQPGDPLKMTTNMKKGHSFTLFQHKRTVGMCVQRRVKSICSWIEQMSPDEERQ